jgi:hypothetical protein
LPYNGAIFEEKDLHVPKGKALTKYAVYSPPEIEGL